MKTSKPEPLLEEKRCHNCGSSIHKLTIICGNEIHSIFWYCPKCNKFFEGEVDA